jgi:ribonuclease E
MAKRMLVDATQPEEIRVVVVSGNRLEELDFEIASRKQLKGNIYLAKVTRVEPSLQAAFVEYGGNRHGFLAFSEIHPDYYRIPVADREALLAEERRYAELADEADDEPPPPRRSAAPAASRHQATITASAEPEAPGAGQAEDATGMHGPDEDRHEDGVAAEDLDAGTSLETAGAAVPAVLVVETRSDEGPGLDEAPGSDEVPPAGLEHSLSFEDGALPEAVVAGETVAVAAFEAEDHDHDAHNHDGDDHGGDDHGGDDHGVHDVNDPDSHGHDHGGGESVETAEAVNLDVIGGDEVEEMVRRRPRPLRSYKIQEVIKRRQILLVQVTKEERGTKGAALTTYLSLPGRYCVLMPNTGRGGGVSRKITNPQDRKRLKEMLSDLDVPQGMAVILRTAGLERSKAEIKRDLEYLLRLWDSIREQTLQSTAPELIYEEANLIKRSIRDLYANDIDEVLVEGEQGYRLAKDFMRMLVPSHAKRVQPYRDETIPLFFRYQVETQIDAIHGPVVQLKSGGYIVINPTEALVAIDVNSGRSTRERNIEETAFKTNLEASDEIARQLRLRDLAGLIVIDYIDMEDNRNNLAVERRLKEAMKTDRARIQLGRISPFGLLELSRQRLRPSLLETNFERCPHCSGTGVIRSIESAALHTLRAVEEEGIRRRSTEITVAVASTVALYILNFKRVELARIEQRYGMRVALLADESLIIPDLRVERVRARGPGEDIVAAVGTERVFAEAERLVDTDVEDEDEEEEVTGVAEAPAGARVAESRTEDGGEEGRERRGGRRGRRGRRRHGSGERPGEAATLGIAPDAVEVSGEAGTADNANSAEASSAETVPAGIEIGADGQPRKRRRGKRGGRRRGRGREGAIGESGVVPEAEADSTYQAEADSTYQADADSTYQADADTGYEAGTDAGHETEADDTAYQAETIAGSETGVDPGHPAETGGPETVPAAVDAPRPVDVIAVEDFDWFLDGERPIAAVVPSEVAGTGPVTTDLPSGVVPAESGGGEAAPVGPADLQTPADSADLLSESAGGPAAESFPVAAETGAGEAGAADATAPRRRSRRRSGTEGELEATVVRRTRRRVKMAPNGEEAPVEVATEIAPDAGAEIVPEPLPVTESATPVPVAPDGVTAPDRVELEDDAIVAPTERPDEVPPPAATIVTDAPLPAPSRDAVADDLEAPANVEAPADLTPIPSLPPRRGWWSKG